MTKVSLVLKVSSPSPDPERPDPSVQVSLDKEYDGDPTDVSLNVARDVEYLSFEAIRRLEEKTRK